MQYRPNKGELDERHMLFMLIGFAMFLIAIFLVVHGGLRVRFGNVVEIEKQPETPETDDQLVSATPTQYPAASEPKAPIVQIPHVPVAPEVRSYTPTYPLKHFEEQSPHDGWAPTLKLMEMNSQLKDDMLDRERTFDLERQAREKERDELVSLLRQMQEEMDEIKSGRQAHHSLGQSELKTIQEIQEKIKQLRKQPARSPGSETDSQTPALTPWEKAQIVNDLKKEIKSHRGAAGIHFYRESIFTQRLERRKLGLELSEFVDLKKGTVNWNAVPLLPSRYPGQTFRISQEIAALSKSSTHNYSEISALCDSLLYQMKRDINATLQSSGRAGISSDDYMAARRMLEFLRTPHIYLPGFVSQSLAENDEQKLPVPDPFETTPLEVPATSEIIVRKTLDPFE